MTSSSKQSLRLSRLSRPGLVVGAVALALAGCGGGSSASSPSPRTAAPQPLSKAAYEQRLGPLFIRQVDPAINAAVANGGAADPQRLGQAISSLQTAHDAMASITPPTAIADLQRQAVAVLQSTIRDATRMLNAEKSHDRAALVPAATSLVSDGRQLVSISRGFLSRGY